MDTKMKNLDLQKRVMVEIFNDTMSLEFPVFNKFNMPRISIFKSMQINESLIITAS